MRRYRLVTGLVIAVLAAVPAVQGQNFDFCGVLLPGQGECLLFVPDARWMPVVLENYDGYGEGAHVHVQGWLDTSCVTACPEAIGCVDSNTIADCAGGTPWEGNGLLDDTGGCVVFRPASEPDRLWLLDEYSHFEPGDSVFVTGFQVAADDTTCPAATRRLRDNLIEPWQDTDTSGQQVNTCGVLIQGTDCVLLAAPGQAGGPMEYFELSSYNGMSVGDTLCVNGHIPDSSTTSCSDATAYLVVDGFEPPPPPDGYFEDGGVLVAGSNCTLFASSALPGHKLTLERLADFQVGDSVFVTGYLRIPSELSCPDAHGDLIDNTIAPASPFGSYFIGDGELVDSAGCVLFSPYDEPGTLYLLDTYLDLAPGDIVHVNGLIDMGCENTCTAADGCIRYNIIIPLMNAPSGEMVLRLTNGFSVHEIVGAVGGSVLDSIAGKLTYLVDIPDTVELGGAAQEFGLNPGVEWVHPNYIYSVPEVHQMSISFPDESAPTYVPHETPIEFFDQTGGNGTDLDSAQMLSTDQSVLVAVIDNGFDLDHPLLDGCWAAGGYDFLDDDPDPSAEPGDLQEHGTFVAGLVRLAAPDVVILPLRAFDSEGIGNSFAVAEAIDYAVMQGADIINMSFGMYTANDVLSNAVDAATSAGVTMVASVGNESVQQATYPAAYDDVVAVSAIDTLEQAAFFTNGGDYVDVCAPGVNLYSSLTGPWDWGTWSGTSFAAPLVTGATALLLSIRPDLSPTGVSETLRQSARTELVSGTVITPDLLLGYGCIDAFSASLAYARGDVDNSGAVDVGDLVRLAGYMFGDGEAPEVSLRMADINCDSTLDISDVVRLTGFMFQGGEPIWPCIE